MNQQAMLRQLKKMQEDMEKTQREIEETIFTSSAGGVVTIEMLGNKQLQNVTISDDFTVDGKEDLDMLGEMVVAACSQAYSEIDKFTKTKMAKFQSFLGGMGNLF
jgi:DNA-binding YbaB/EbfC family protein